MKKKYLSISLALLSVNVFATSGTEADKVPFAVYSDTQESPIRQSNEANEEDDFVGEYQNEEFKIFIRINLKEKNITVPNQDILGELDGYIGSTQCDHVWPIVSSQVNGNQAKLEIINNFGSEDFVAILTKNDDGTLTLKHVEGSTLKFPVKKKWQKIPSKIVFHKK